MREIQALAAEPPYLAEPQDSLQTRIKLDGKSLSVTVLIHEPDF